MREVRSGLHSGPIASNRRSDFSDPLLIGAGEGDGTGQSRRTVEDRCCNILIGAAVDGDLERPGWSASVWPWPIVGSMHPDRRARPVELGQHTGEVVTGPSAVGAGQRSNASLQVEGFADRHVRVLLQAEGEAVLLRLRHAKGGSQVNPGPAARPALTRLSLHVGCPRAATIERVEQAPSGSGKAWTRGDARLDAVPSDPTAALASRTALTVWLALERQAPPVGGLVFDLESSPRTRTGPLPDAWPRRSGARSGLGPVPRRTRPGLRICVGPPRSKHPGPRPLDRWILRPHTATAQLRIRLASPRSAAGSEPRSTPEPRDGLPGLASELER